MSLLTRCCTVALLSCASVSAAQATEVLSYDAQSAAPLGNLPIHLVAVNDRLRAQIGYDYVQMEGITQQAQMQAFNTPGVDPLSAALGGMIGSALVKASMREAAEYEVAPAYALLRIGQCDLPMHEAYQTALSRSIATSPWGQAAQVYPHLLGPKQSVDDVAGKKGGRYVLTFAYSLTPDFSSVVTAISAQAYSDALPGAPKRWENTPVWSNVIYVVSDRMLLDPKKPEDVDNAIADEKTRYETSDAPALIARANAGDRYARGIAVKHVREHERLMREAKAERWTPSQEAMRRSRLWSENGCARLKDVLDANVQEVEAVISQLFRGELPVHDKNVPALDPLRYLPNEVDGERRVSALGAGVHVARRGGDRVPLAYARSWLDVPSK